MVLLVFHLALWPCLYISGGTGEELRCPDLVRYDPECNCLGDVPSVGSSGDPSFPPSVSGEYETAAVVTDTRACSPVGV